MKLRRVLSLLTVLSVALCLFVMPASAVEEEEHIEIVILNEDISEETKAEIIEFYSNPHNHDDYEGAATYGITCTLFGHKLESTQTKVITHKARTTAPRCLQKTYEYESCTRCDYSTSTLLSSKYISCC